VTPQGNADGCENKGLAEKAIRKNMKTKGEQKPRLKLEGLNVGTSGPKRNQVQRLQLGAEKEAGSC
jgi:hypothetical protein